jgi:hypothetical protein
MPNATTTTMLDTRATGFGVDRIGVDRIGVDRIGVDRTVVG